MMDNLASQPFFPMILYSLGLIHFLEPIDGFTLCPVTSPMGDNVYITDRPTAVEIGLKRTECASHCAFYKNLYGGSSQCRCFNYNSTVLNCSLFNFEPQNCAIDNTGSVMAYQFAATPINALFTTVPSSSCGFPFVYKNEVYFDCRFNAAPTCEGQNQFGCYLSNGQQAFCNRQQAIVPPPYRLVEPSSCSYPYTYHGALYYSCMMDVSQSVTSGYRYTCLVSNYTLAFCNLPADYAASVDTVQVTVGSQEIVAPSVAGWIVVLQRSSTDNFDQNWNTYKLGFGSYNTYIWLGLEPLYRLTSASGVSYRLRVELKERNTGRWFSAEYWTFKVANEANFYTLTVMDYFGDYGDAFRCGNPSKEANGKRFYTSDSGGSQCVGWGSGWWYDYCTCSCLTCQQTCCGGYDTYAWRLDDNNPPSSIRLLQYGRMMIKPVQP